jgi:hypothetical protein
MSLAVWFIFSKGSISRAQLQLAEARNTAEEMKPIPKNVSVRTMYRLQYGVYSSLYQVRTDCSLRGFLGQSVVRRNWSDVTWRVMRRTRGSLIWCQQRCKRGARAPLLSNQRFWIFIYFSGVRSTVSSWTIRVLGLLTKTFWGVFCVLITCFWNSIFYARIRLILNVLFKILSNNNKSADPRGVT